MPVNLIQGGPLKLKKTTYKLKNAVTDVLLKRLLCVSASETSNNGIDTVEYFFRAQGGDYGHG
jgi:hypothetical protein